MQAGAVRDSLSCPKAPELVILSCCPLVGVALYVWRREASNEQRLMCCVGPDVSLVLSATWVIYVCVARGTCARSELPESTRRVEGGSGPQPNFLEGAAPSDTDRVRTEMGE